jgi:hypothetical protein
MGGARFGLLDGLLLLLLQGSGCWLALQLAARQGRLNARWLALTAGSYAAAFIVHIAAFAILARLLPGEGLRGLRRLVVVIVWTAICALTAWLLARSWNVEKPQLLVRLVALASAAAYGLFVVWGLYARPL